MLSKLFQFNISPDMSDSKTMIIANQSASAIGQSFPFLGQIEVY